MMRLVNSAFAVSLLVIALLMSVSPAAAQQTSGSISGVVQDSQQAVIPGATVILIDQRQGTVARQMSTSAVGTFTFTPLINGVYTVTVESPGFKTYTQTDIILNAGTRMGLPPIVLELGAVGEVIFVEANAVSLQTVSAERSGVVSTSQISDLALRTRDFRSLMATIPGASSDSQSVNGGRTDQNSYNLDGVSVIDTGCNCSTSAMRLNTDILEEVKVLTNGLSAEFGRSTGANVSMITKGGTQDFHGGAYLFMRNEWMNANTWENNYYGRPRNISRNSTSGVNLGGPIYKEKLFFFFNLEWQRPLTPDAFVDLTLPTAAERAGDFSLTHEADGSLVTITDPLTGLPFPNNTIPTNRINKYGAEILNMFDLPNAVGVDPTFNHQYSFPSTNIVDQQTFRIDYNISDNWKFYFRFARLYNPRETSGGLNASNNVGLSPFEGKRGSISGMGNLTTIISPTLTNEISYGNSRSFLPNKVPEDSRYRRANSGVTLPLLVPDADPNGIVPGLGFGSSVPNAPAIDFMGLPYDNENPLENWRDNVAKILPNHTLKFGLYIEHGFKRQTASAPNNGKLDFSRDSGNPGDTNWGFSNALLGSFKSYDQANDFLKGYYHYWNYEWYAQDNWRVLPNLTLDYGLRMALLPPMYEQYDNVAGFVPGLFDPSQQVSLFQKTLVNGKPASLNPLTGAVGPAIEIGSIVPGVGQPFNGMVTPGSGAERGLIDSRGIQWAPRIGVAWSPLGADSKTVIRAGGGVFYERIQGNLLFNQILYPPILELPRINYGNLSTIQQAQGQMFPVTAAGVETAGNLPTVYNYNFGLQHELPFQMLLDVSYVGSISRHLTGRTPFNENAFGSAWLPENQDPTVEPMYDGSTTKAVDFYRPYVGYAGYGSAAGGNHPGGGGFVTSFGTNANYNSLQVALNRRFSSGLQFGLAYTWSKALGTLSALNQPAHPVDSRKADYGVLDFDRTQNLVINYSYTIPSPIPQGSALDNAFGRTLFSGWQITGISTFTSGAPGMISYKVKGYGTTALNRAITGSEPQAPRVVMSGNPNLSGGGRSLEAWIDTSVFSPALKGSMGMDSGKNTYRGPGINNFDISLFKNISLGAESRYIQLRLEMYNAFNHTQWNRVNTSAQFDSAGNITNLPTALGGGGGRFGFGALNRSRMPREIQFAAKFYF